MGYGEVGWKNIVDAATKFFILVLYFVVLQFEFGGIIGLSIVWIVRSLITGLLSYQCIKRYVGSEVFVKQLVNWSDIRKYIRPAFDWFIMGFGAFLVLKTDHFFITSFIGPEALPDYAAAYRLVAIVAIFAGTISTMSMTFTSRLSSAKEKKNVYRMLYNNTSLGMITLFAGLSILALFGDTVIKLWLGDGHFVGWPVLWVFCIMQSLESHHVYFAQTGMSSNRDPVWGKVSMVSGVINLILTYFGVRLYGLVGVALATNISQMLTSNWYAVWKTLKLIDLTFVQYLKKSGFFWIFFGAIIFSIQYFIHSMVVSEYTALSLAFLSSLILYSFFIFLFYCFRKHS